MLPCVQLSVLFGPIDFHHLCFWPRASTSAFIFVFRRGRGNHNGPSLALLCEQRHWA
uniref:Uncharacterized protein n=1 Tax=Anguilla anguilla TaxID=7936 RepID=A0A0E9QQI1_ANGAN